MIVSKFLKNLIFPRKCCFCMRTMDFSETFDSEQAIICRECYSKYEQIGWLTGQSRLGAREVRVDGVFALYEYRDGVKNAIRQLKFAHAKGNGRLFGELLRKRLADVIDSVDYVIPIPISKKRELERGYNQCDVIAHSMVRGTRAKVVNNILFKRDKISRQSRKSGQERNEDSLKSFEINPNINLLGKKIIILDDILTTGSTLAAAVDLIRKLGADTIYCVVFSIAWKRTSISNKYKKNR